MKKSTNKQKRARHEAPDFDDDFDEAPDFEDEPEAESLSPASESLPDSSPLSAPDLEEAPDLDFDLDEAPDFDDDFEEAPDFEDEPEAELHSLDSDPSSDFEPTLYGYSFDIIKKTTAPNDHVSALIGSNSSFDGSPYISVILIKLSFCAGLNNILIGCISRCAIPISPRKSIPFNN
ncbi:hypothetical protein DERP_013851 [Dermatophagoides pteronyssinus]|uniref:Uncharacterized protein n=1 Tax=Dermatophagoides pteronyssinus TaxID=6956 RepID=A0ABQ8J3E1_DERPT|nr:hypothetical protein DERP_013851 [Dermatophagoides pteronyssinus]